MSGALGSVGDEGGTNVTAKLEKRIEIEPVLLGDVIRNVPLYTEDQTYWDWAACIKMAVEYYTGNRDIRQCEIVNAYTTRTDCCGRPRSQHCNFGLKENDVAQAFRSQGIRALKHPGQGGVALSELSRLLADNQIPFWRVQRT